MGTLIHDLQHHAKDKYEVAAALALAFTTMLNPDGWQVRQAGAGNNSWRLFHPDGGCWYFTGYDSGAVVVRNSFFWRNVTEHHKLRTRLDTIRFAHGLQLTTRTKQVAA